MAFKSVDLNIDTMKRNNIPIEGINQEDNVKLNIIVTENGKLKDLSNQTIKAYIRRVDGTLVEQADQITTTEASQGKISIDLKNSAFNTEGVALFQLDISDSNGRITSSYATFKIGKGLISDEAIANTNEVNALKQIEEYVEKANKELEVFAQTVATINENEATRQENEAARVREETSRNEAEVLREKAEATREGRLKALETEVTNARTATTGEDFKSLDERIDAEVDRINKKVEFSFMQQEGAESHKLENTIVGMTTDMVIKGKTVYKKSDGSYTDVWEESSTLESFGEKEENKISILSNAKNLINLEEKKEGYFQLNDQPTQFANSFFVQIKVKPNTDYTIQFLTDNLKYRPMFVELEEKNKVSDNSHYYGNSVTGNYVKTLRTKNNTNYISVSVLDNPNYKDFKIMLEEGKSATPYEPYKCDKKDILLPFQNGLKGIGSVQDELISNTRKAIERIGKRAYQVGDEALENVITDKTNTYYVLEEPVEHELSVEVNVSTYEDRTYVDFNNSIKGTSTFKAPVNTLKTIARLSDENTRLKRGLALHAENITATDEAITDYSLDMDYKLCLLEMELAEIKKQLGGK